MKKGRDIAELTHTAALERLAELYFEAGFMCAVVCGQSEPSLWRQHWEDRDKHLFLQRIHDLKLAHAKAPVPQKRMALVE